MVWSRFDCAAQSGARTLVNMNNETCLQPAKCHSIVASAQFHFVIDNGIWVLSGRKIESQSHRVNEGDISGASTMRMSVINKRLKHELRALRDLCACRWDTWECECVNSEYCARQTAKRRPHSNASNGVPIALGVFIPYFHCPRCVMRSRTPHGTNELFCQLLLTDCLISLRDHRGLASSPSQRSLNESNTFHLCVFKFSINSNTVHTNRQWKLWRHVFGGKVLPNRTPHAVETQLPSKNHTWNERCCWLFTVEQTKSTHKHTQNIVQQFALFSLSSIFFAFISLRLRNLR